MADINSVLNNVSENLFSASQILNQTGRDLSNIVSGLKDSYEGAEKSAKKADIAVERLARSITSNVTDITKQFTSLVPVLGRTMQAAIENTMRSWEKGLARVIERSLSGGSTAPKILGGAAIAGLLTTLRLVGKEYNNIVNAQINLAKETGFHGERLSQVLNITTNVYKQNLLYGFSMEEARKSTASLVTALGSADRVTSDLVQTNMRLARFAGVSADNMSKLTATLTTGLQMSSKEAYNFANIIANRANKAGQNASALIRDMAINFNLVAMHAERGAEYIQRMASHSAKTRIGLEQIQNLGDIFLDFERGSELIAKINALTGSSLNSFDMWNKARQADSEGILLSLKQAFSTAKAQRVLFQDNVGVANQLAKSLGLSFTQLQNLSRTDLSDLLKEPKNDVDAITMALDAQYSAWGKIKNRISDAVLPTIVDISKKIVDATNSTMSFLGSGDNSGMQKLAYAAITIAGALSAAYLGKLLISFATIGIKLDQLVNSCKMGCGGVSGTTTTTTTPTPNKPRVWQRFKNFFTGTAAAKAGEQMQLPFQSNQSIGQKILERGRDITGSVAKYLNFGNISRVFSNTLKAVLTKFGGNIPLISSVILPILLGQEVSVQNIIGDVLGFVVGKIVQSLGYAAAAGMTATGVGAPAGLGTAIATTALGMGAQYYTSEYIKNMKFGDDPNNQKYQKNALGGVYNRPTLAMIGEEGRDEIVIPTGRIREGLPINSAVADQLSSIGVPGFAYGFSQSTQSDRSRHATVGGNSVYSSASSLGEIRRREQEIDLVSERYHGEIKERLDKIYDMTERSYELDRHTSRYSIPSFRYNSPTSSGGGGRSGGRPEPGTPEYFKDVFKGLFEDAKNSIEDGIDEGYNIWKKSLTETQRRWLQNGENTVEFFKKWQEGGFDNALMGMYRDPGQQRTFDDVLGFLLRDKRRSDGGVYQGQEDARLIGSGLRRFLFANQLGGLSLGRSAMLGIGDVLGMASSNIKTQRYGSSGWGGLERIFGFGDQESVINRGLNNVVNLFETPFSFAKNKYTQRQDRLRQRQIEREEMAYEEEFQQFAERSAIQNQLLALTPPPLTLGGSQYVAGEPIIRVDYNTEDFSDSLMADFGQSRDFSTSSLNMATIPMDATDYRKSKNLLVSSQPIIPQPNLAYRMAPMTPNLIGPVDNAFQMPGVTAIANNGDFNINAQFDRFNATLMGIEQNTKIGNDLSNISIGQFAGLGRDFDESVSKLTGDFGQFTTGRGLQSSDPFGLADQSAAFMGTMGINTDISGNTNIQSLTAEREQMVSESGQIGAVSQLSDAQLKRMDKNKDSKPTDRPSYSASEYGKAAGLAGLSAAAQSFGQFGFNRQGARSALQSGVAAAGSTIFQMGVASGNPWAIAGGLVLSIGAGFAGKLAGRSRTEKRLSAIEAFQTQVIKKGDVAAFTKSKDLKESMKNPGARTKILQAITSMFGNVGLGFKEAQNLVNFLILDRSTRLKHPDRVYWNKRLFNLSDEQISALEGGSEAMAQYDTKYKNMTQSDIEKKMNESLNYSDNIFRQDTDEQIVQRLVNEANGAARARGQNLNLQASDYIKNGQVDMARLQSDIASSGLDIANYISDGNIGGDGGSQYTGPGAAPVSGQPLPPEFFQMMDQLNNTLRSFSKDTTIKVMLNGQQVAEALVDHNATM